MSPSDLWRAEWRDGHCGCGWSHLDLGGCCCEAGGRGERGESAVVIAGFSTGNRIPGRPSFFHLIGQFSRHLFVEDAIFRVPVEIDELFLMCFMSTGRWSGELKHEVLDVESPLRTCCTRVCRRAAHVRSVQMLSSFIACVEQNGIIFGRRQERLLDRDHLFKTCKGTLSHSRRSLTPPRAKET